LQQQPFSSENENNPADSHPSFPFFVLPHLTREKQTQSFLVINRLLLLTKQAGQHTINEQERSAFSFIGKQLLAVFLGVSPIKPL
jgi:hypothetical protein